MTRSCSIESCRAELAESPMAGPAHAIKHKNEFERLTGRRPEDYAEVRALLNRGEWPDDVDEPTELVEQLTLQDVATRS